MPKSSDLPLGSSAAELIVNEIVNGKKRTARVPLALLQIEAAALPPGVIGALEDRVAAVEEGKTPLAVAADAKIGPGEYPILWTSDVDTAESPAALSASLAVNDSDGRVIRLSVAAKAGPIALFRIEPGRKYKGRFAFRRRVNASDPANDAVRLAVRWFDQSKTPIAGPSGTTILADITTLTTGSGRQAVTVVIAREAGSEIDFVAPAGARYVRPFIQTFGTGAVTDIEVIDLADITDAALFAPDVADFDARLTAQESLELGDRTDAIESQLLAPNQLRLSTAADLVAAAVPASVQTVYLLGYSDPGIGPQTLKRSTGPAAAGKIQSADGAWWLLQEPAPRAVQFGDVSGDASALLETAASYAKSLQIDGAVTAAAAGQDKLRDVIFYGEGSLTGAYRKFVVPPTADVFVPSANDILPRHIAKLHAKKNPVFVIVGDSTATYNANTTGRQVGLAFALELWARGILRPDQTPIFYNRSVGGQTYLGFYSSGTTTPIGPDLDWWINGKSWNQQVSDLNPDAVILAFGMNDAANVAIFSAATVHSLIDQIRAWPSSPNIILCTNLIPSLGADGDPTHMVRGVQDARDRVAGITRTMAKHKDVGLLDFHRQFCAARDAFDPCTSTLINQELASVLVGAQRRSPSETIDFMVEFDLNLDAMAADSTNDTMIVKIGPSALDWLRISKTAVGGTATRVQLSTGTGSLPYNYANTTVPWLGTGVRTLRVEVRGNLATLYDPTIGGPEGTNAPAIWSGRLVREGGWFTPLVYMGDLTDIDGTLTSVSFWTAQQRIHRPTLRDRDLFGGGSAPGEGSLYNHPGNRLAAFVYDPVLRAAAARPTESIRGSYTPTGTAVANVSSLTMLETQFREEADWVEVFGFCEPVPMAGANTKTELDISLPIPSNLANAYDLGGSATAHPIGYAVVPAMVAANAADDRARLSFMAPAAGYHLFEFHFRYRKR